MTVRTSEQIIDMVGKVEDTTLSRVVRMDADRQLLRLKPFNANTDVEGVDLGTDYRSFTSNEPATFYRKVSSILSESKLLIQVPYGMAQSQERFRYDLAERFYYGCMSSANERLLKRAELELQDQMAGINPVRGWGAIFVLIRNRADGTSFPDMQVWDVRNMFWQEDEDGLVWACYKSSRTVRQVRAEYPDAVMASKFDDADVVDVYNFFDRQHNTVVVESALLKKSLEHGWNEVPVRVLPIGPMPRIWDEGDVAGEDNDTETDYGESIFASNRGMYGQLNELFSIHLELVSKQLHQTYLREADPDDEPLEESPNVSDAVIDIEPGRKLTPLEHVETTKDNALLLQSTTGMIQRGALPYTSYGAVDFSLSGFAITQLNAQERTVFMSIAKNIGNLIKMACNMLADQFTSGRFNPMTLRGFGNNRDYMQVTMLPEMMMNLPPPIVQLVPELPQDDVAKMAMAQQARTGDFGPLLPDRYIRDNMLKLPDAALIQREIEEQQARVASPAALSFSLGKSSLEQGEQELAQIHFKDLRIQQLMQELQVLQLQMAAGPQQPGGQQPGLSAGPTPGLEPEVLPFIMQNGTPAPSPRQGGRNQPQGAPRPGGRTPDNAAGLRNFGNEVV